LQNTYKAVIIGAGDRGNAYMKAIKEAGGIEFSGVCDAAPQRLDKAAAEYKFAAAGGDYKELIASVKPDIVIIATPAYFHCDIAKFAMENGAHVLTEKPFDLSLKKCFELKDVAAKTGKKLAVGLQYRNKKGNRAMKHAIARGLLGKKITLTYTDFRETRPKTLMHDAEFGNGGPMVDMSCHFFDLMSWFYNSKPKSAFSVWSTMAENREMLKDIAVKAPDTAIIIVEYESGDLGVVNVCWGLPSGCNGEYTVYGAGDEGYLKTFTPGEKGSAVIVRENGEEITVGIPKSELGELKNSEATVLRSLISSVENGGEPQVSFDSAIYSLATSMAAIRSSKLGRPVQISEILDEKPTVLESMMK